MYSLNHVITLPCRHSLPLKNSCLSSQPSLDDCSIRFRNHHHPTSAPNMDISIRLDHPTTIYTNGDMICGEVVLYCPSATTVSKIAASLIGESTLNLTGNNSLLASWNQEDKHRVSDHQLDHGTFSSLTRPLVSTSITSRSTTATM